MTIDFIKGDLMYCLSTLAEGLLELGLISPLDTYELISGDTNRSFEIVAVTPVKGRFAACVTLDLEAGSDPIPSPPIPLGERPVANGALKD